MPTLKEVIAAHNTSQDHLIGAFRANLHTIVLRAQGRVIARLTSRLAITDGVIDSTAGNMLILRNAGKLFMTELDRAGYQRLVDSFVAEFPGSLQFLQETLEILGKQAGRQWGRDLGFTQKDLALLGGVQANTVAALTGAMEAVAGQAVTRGLFGVAGLKFESLVEMLTDKLETSIGNATSIGNTAASTFFRTASDRAYQIIQQDVPEQVLRFVYSGPRDRLERSFCRHLTDVDKSYTREQIDRMDNHQFPVGSCFTTAGGFNCRHGWYISTRDLLEEQAA